MININFKGFNKGVSNGVCKWIVYLLMVIITISMLPILLLCSLFAGVFYIFILIAQAVYECFNKLFSPRI